MGITKHYYELSVIIFQKTFMTTVNLLLNIIPYQNNDENFLTYFSKISYIVHYHLAKILTQNFAINKKISLMKK